MRPTTIGEYLCQFSNELGDRVLADFPPLHEVGAPCWPEVRQLRRQPFPAQEVAIMGTVRRFQGAKAAAVIAECGAGKTLMALGSIWTHSRGRPFTALFMVPPQILEKTCRETFLTLPGVRVFVIDALRNGANSNGHSGVNEVKLRNGRIVREGYSTTLTDMRLRKGHRSARARWASQCKAPAVFCMSRERGKLGWFWRHAYHVPRSGPFVGQVVNPDTGCPVISGEDQLRRADFRKIRRSEFVFPAETDGTQKARRPFFSALWQPDNSRIHRAAPIEFIGRHMRGFFDYCIADEVHELKGGDTAQGNALGTLASVADRILVLTGTLLGGYAEDLYHVLFRLQPGKMVEDGFAHGDAGARQFTDAYGVLESITTIEPEENACSKAKVTTRTRRRPGASPLLFGRYLMEMAAFVSLEDISEALPPFQEEVIAVEMEQPLKSAYEELERDIKEALKAHHGNQSVLSTAMNALLIYPDRPFDIGDLYGYESNRETGERERFLIASPVDLPHELLYAKERLLLEEVRAELAQGRKCVVYAVYTQKFDVTRRLQSLLQREGIRAELLTTDVPPEHREAWYEQKLRQGMQVMICHPKLVQTGLDLVLTPSILFWETGYSTYVLRQASRRSWRIGQKQPVRVVYFAYQGTAQEACLRLMGKKLLVSLAMEGKFTGQGLGDDGDDDVLTAMARELVNEKGVGERAAEIWKTLQKQRASLIAAPPPVSVEAEVVPEVEAAAPAPAPVAVMETPQPNLLPGLAQFGVATRRGTRRPIHRDEAQLLLGF